MIVLPKKIAAPLEFYECEECEDFPEDRYSQEQEQKAENERIANELRAKTADIAQRSNNGLSGVASALSSSATDKPAKVSSKSLSLTVAKKSANDDSGNSSLDGDESGSSIAMPKFGDMFKDTSSMGSVSTKLIVSKSNPFQSAGSSSGVSGPIVTLSLSDDSGSDLDVNNTKNPFVIKIPPQEEAGEISASVSIVDFNYHKVNFQITIISLLIIIKKKYFTDIFRS